MIRVILIAQQTSVGRKFARDIHPAIYERRRQQLIIAGSTGTNVPIPLARLAKKFNFLNLDLASGLVEKFVTDVKTVR